MKVLLFFLCMTFVSFFAWTQNDFIEELTRLVQLSDAGRFQDAIAGYQKLINTPATPGWLKAGSYFEIADLSLKAGHGDAALPMLKQAIATGFDDCLEVQKGDLNKHPDFQHALSQIKISESDYHELHWLHAERQNVDHDAKMMITANMNRMDDHFTEIPQSVIPTRKTDSEGVLYARAQLKLMQQAQRYFVHESDSERIKHVTTLSITSGGPDMTAVLQSLADAEAAAQQRKRDISARVFSPSGNPSTILQPCLSEK